MNLRPVSKPQNQQSVNQAVFFMCVCSSLCICDTCLGALRSQMKVLNSQELELLVFVSHCKDAENQA